MREELKADFRDEGRKDGRIGQAQPPGMRLRERAVGLRAGYRTGKEDRADDESLEPAGTDDVLRERDHDANTGC